MISNFKQGFTPRKEQIEIINKLDDAWNNRGIKFVICSAPTGTGKSFLSSSISNSSPKPHKDWIELVNSYDVYKKIPDSNSYPGEDFFLTHEKYGTNVLTLTKSLQDQYIKDFQEASLAKGKASTPCFLDPNFTTEFSYCSLNTKQLYKCWNDNCCEYYVKQNEAILSQFGVLNYSKFLSLPPHLKYKKYLVLDECSEIEKVLVNQYTVEFLYKNLDKLNINYQMFSCSINNDILRDKDKLKAHGWLSGLNTMLEKLYKSKIIAGDISKIDQKKQLEIKIIKRLMDNLGNLLGIFSENQYIVEYSVEGIKFIPFKVDNLSKNLFDYCDHVLLMSATIVDHKNFAKTLGIKDYEYIEVDSPFDPKKSPIITFKDMGLNNKNLDEYMPKIVKLVDQILETHSGDKGVMHTHTMKITKYIEENSNNKNRLLVRSQIANNERIVKEHMLRKDDTVLVSPSLTFGTDLVGDLARFSIIIKAAYPSLGDTRIKKKFEEDKIWYENQMLIETIQATGRATRNIDDYSITYIIDSNVLFSVIRNKNKLPKHFLKRFE